MTLSMGDIRRNANIPNVLTISRLAAVPFLVYLLVIARYDIAFWLFIAMAASDLLDGILARVLKSRTTLGANLDPIADKLAQLGAFIPLALTPDSRLPLWLAILVVGRDLTITAGIVYLKALGRVVKIDPLFVGKACTNAQFFTAANAMLVVYLQHGSFHTGAVEILNWLLFAAVWITTALTVWSGAAYIRWGVRILKEPVADMKEVA